jgi:ATP-dependent Clp protease ATP-binding subunit ClpX
MAQKLKCSFCDRGQDSVEKLISSPKNHAYICDGCVRVCGSILTDDGMDLALPPRPAFRMRLARRIAGLSRVSVIPKN